MWSLLLPEEPWLCREKRARTATMNQSRQLGGYPTDGFFCGRDFDISAKNRKAFTFADGLGSVCETLKNSLSLWRPESRYFQR
jgi:hypothetical protein